MFEHIQPRFLTPLVSNSDLCHPLLPDMALLSPWTSLVATQNTWKLLNLMSKQALGHLAPYLHTLCPAKHPMLYRHTAFWGQNSPEVFRRRLEQKHDPSPILGYSFTTGCCCCGSKRVSWELDVHFLRNLLRRGKCPVESARCWCLILKSDFS